MSRVNDKTLLVWYWRRYLHKYCGLIALALAFMALEGAMSAGLAYMMQPLFDEGFVAENATTLARIGFILMFIFVGRGLASVAQKVVLARVSQMSMGDVRQSLLEHLMRQDQAFHKDHGPGYLIQRIEGDVGAMSKLWNSLLTGAGRDIVQVIAMLGMALWVDWQWTLGVLLGAPLLVLPAVVLQRYVRRNARSVRDLAARMSTRLNEVFLGIVPVKLNRLERYQAKQYRALTRDRVRAEVRAVAGQASLPGLIDILSGIAFAAILYFVGQEIGAGKKTVGEFMRFAFAIGMVFEPLRRLGAISGVWQVAAASIERIKELAEIEPPLRDPANPVAPPVGIPDVRFENATLSFGEAQVLRGLDLNAASGKVTALVGASGAGKSTVFNILTRLVDPDSGSVTIGGVPVADMKLADLRGLISVVSQDALLFDETLRENIVLDLDVTDAQLQSALDAAHVSDFLPRLEHGLDTRVGPRGSALSGGQRQRVAIARALLRDTPILLLDEATSALDAQSEAVVQQALDRLSKGRTTLVIAHRLSTIRNADTIIVMDQGKVVDQGTHDSLISRSGPYAELHQMQFSEG